MTDNYQFDEYLQYPWLESTSEPSNCPFFDGNALETDISPLSSSTFNPIVGVNWDAFSGPAFGRPVSTTKQSTLPPSPAHSPREIEDQQITLADFLRQTDIQNIDPTLSCNNYPSPLSSTSPYPDIESPATDIQSPVVDKVESPQSSIHHQVESTVPSIPRRGPGRPSKAQLAKEKAEGKPSAKNIVTMRRVIHNDSAMRSRARFNTVLDELWNEIPEKEQMEDASRQLCRAEKIEIIISYVRRLQKRSNRIGVY